MNDLRRIDVVSGFSDWATMSKTFRPSIRLLIRPSYSAS